MDQSEAEEGDQIDPVCEAQVILPTPAKAI
jgi:hypothetical protein